MRGGIVILPVFVAFYLFIFSSPNIKKHLGVFLTVWCKGVSEIPLTYPSTWVDCVRDECSTWQPMVEACFLVAAQEQSSCHFEGQTSTDFFLKF